MGHVNTVSIVFATVWISNSNGILAEAITGRHFPNAHESGSSLEQEVVRWKRGPFVVEYTVLFASRTRGIPHKKWLLSRGVSTCPTSAAYSVEYNYKIPLFVQTMTVLRQWRWSGVSAWLPNLHTWGQTSMSLACTHVCRLCVWRQKISSCDSHCHLVVPEFWKCENKIMTEKATVTCNAAIDFITEPHDFT